MPTLPLAPSSTGRDVSDERGAMTVVRHIRDLMSVEIDKPDLLRAQINALSRMIPLLYFILLVNAWVLAYTYYGKAPNWLSLHVALLLSAGCAVRLVQWWRKRGVALTPQQAAHELKRTNRIAAVLGVAVSIWGITLFSYGDAYAQANVGTFLMTAMLSSMICLIHSRSAAIIVAVTVSIPFAIFFAMTGVTAFVGTAINVVMVTGAIIVVILIQYRDFKRMVEAQKRTELLSNENLRLANLDSLTDLPNRRAFFAYLQEAFASARSSQTRVAVGIIDLDGFKPVNDLYGHATGDKLLVEVAARLSSVCSAETFFISRLGGDEFAYVVRTPDDAALIAQGEEIAMMLRAPFALDEATIQISGSVGIAVYPEMASSPTELFERADYALYHGKSLNRGSAVVFSSAHDEQMSEDARIEHALKRADFERELSVVFQPIVDIRSNNTIGFEALARWNSPTLGRVSPGQFIPVAERAGIIGALTRPLLKKALTAATQWSSGSLRLSFNLSAYDLSSAESSLAIASIIEGSKFDASRLDLEITETAFGHDFEQVQRSVEMLRLLGCGISLDDFGTGYSSLSRLHALPLTKIRIDRSFVTGLHNSPASLKIVKSLLALSRDMGLDCVIEGVETPEEMAALRQLGGLMVQGYFYSPPIDEEQVSTYLERPTRAQCA